METTIELIDVAKITDPKNPMRSDIDRERIWELAESIKREGLINPITVRPSGDMFEVVAGHRRNLACRIAGLSRIACVVRDLTDEQADEIKAHENLERQDIDPVDEALFLGRLIGDDEGKIKEVAEKLNRSVSWIEARLAILTYSDAIIQAIKTGKLKLGVAAALARISDPVYQNMYLETAVAQGMTVAQAEYLASASEQGVLKDSGEILPPPLDSPPQAEVKARANCARCGRLAVHPNLRSVFIHVECPADIVEAASAVSPTSPKTV